MPITWPTYTAPPTPTATSAADVWRNYLEHIRLQDERLRFEAKLESDAASTAAQNARAVAEQSVADAGKEQAAATIALAEAAKSMPPGVTEPTVVEIVKTVAARE